MTGTIPESEAIRIAEEAIRGHVKRQAGAPIDVTRADGRYTVTFVNTVPPGTLGADYDAQVKIDETTGDVVEVKVGA
ncbi:MAG TPA: hypothetical protein VGM37_17610 [Armatimonadota bacterium]|jgi:hypothetical protein